MASKSAYWKAVLESAVAHGYPVEGLLDQANQIHEEALPLAALLNGEKLYTVELRYEGIRRKDEDDALLAAYTSDGDLVEKRVEVVEDPSNTFGDPAPQATPAQEGGA